MMGDTDTNNKMNSDFTGKRTEIGQMVSELLQSSGTSDLDEIVEFLKNNPEDLRSFLHEMCRLHQLPGVISMERFHQEADSILRENPEKDYFIWHSVIHDFSQLVDRYGYEFSTRVVDRMLECLQQNLPGNVLICRLFGDCFIGLRCMDGQKYGAQMKVIQQQMNDFFVQNHCAYSICVHVGMYHVTPEDKLHPDVDKMLACARTAQKSLKNTLGWGVRTLSL